MDAMRNWITLKRLQLAFIFMPESVRERTLRLWAIPPGLARAMLSAAEEIASEMMMGGASDSNTVYDVRVTRDRASAMAEKAPWN